MRKATQSGRAAWSAALAMAICGHAHGAAPAADDDTQRDLTPQAFASAHVGQSPIWDEKADPPISVSLEQVTWRLAAGDARLVVVGDSFVAPIWTRVFPAITRIWSFGRLAAVAGGATDQSQICRGLPAATPSWSIQASPGSYRVFNAGGGPEYTALPVRGIAEFGGIGITGLGPNGKLHGIRLWNDTFDPPGTDRPLRFGEEGRVRFLFHTPVDTSRVIDDLVIRTNLASSTIDLLNGARKKRINGQEPDGQSTAATPGQVNAAWTDLPVSLASIDNRPELQIEEATPISLSGKYAHPAGAVWYRLDKDGAAPSPGLYYSYLGDPSWSYRGFWTDRPSLGSLDKFVSVEQMAHWLDVTTLRPEQPVIFVYYFAAEQVGGGPFDEQFPALIDAMTRAATDAGLDDVFHLFVLPHFHEITGETFEDARGFFEDQRNEMYYLAATRGNVAAVSLYDSTEGILFDGSTEARDWLRNNGYSSFSFAGQTVDLADGVDIEGRLLDVFDLHPPSSAAAAFFASRLSDLLDLPVLMPDVDGDGDVDLDDLYEQTRNPVDLNGDGAADLLDNRALEDYLRREELRPERR